MPLMFLNGGGMRGGPLHHLLDGAPLVAATTTAPRYRLYSVADRFPGLLPVAHGGAPITGEVYDVPLDVLRDRLLPAEPPELELGVIELADATASLAMLLRRPPASFPQLTDITGHGGWAAYRREIP
ncbi:gamma-glutamylcyclotransferase [Actinoallomurus sp. WRP9H-5]|nr:gamma-glutamylcyclotransferase [Actinoallomurus rhizosphaericola]